MARASPLSPFQPQICLSPILTRPWSWRGPVPCPFCEGPSGGQTEKLGGLGSFPGSAGSGILGRFILSLDLSLPVRDTGTAAAAPRIRRTWPHKGPHLEAGHSQVTLSPYPEALPETPIGTLSVRWDLVGPQPGSLEGAGTHTRTLLLPPHSWLGSCSKWSRAELPSRSGLAPPSLGLSFLR